MACRSRFSQARTDCSAQSPECAADVQRGSQETSEQIFLLFCFFKSGELLFRKFNSVSPRFFSAVECFVGYVDEGGGIFATMSGDAQADGHGNAFRVDMHRRFTDGTANAFSQVQRIVPCAVGYDDQEFFPSIPPRPVGRTEQCTDPR